MVKSSIGPVPLVILFVAGCSADPLAGEAGLAAPQICAKYATDRKGLASEYHGKEVELVGIVWNPAASDPSGETFVTLYGFGNPGASGSVWVVCKPAEALAGVSAHQK